MTGNESPYIATVEIQIWEWEYRKATEVFANLLEDVSGLRHRFEGGTHGFPPPLRAELRRNERFVRESS